MNSKIDTGYLKERPLKVIFRGFVDKVKTQVGKEETEETYRCTVHYAGDSKQVRWLVTHLATNRSFRCFINKETHLLKLVNRREHAANNHYLLRQFVLFMITQLAIKKDRIRFPFLE